jgi:hypothetical protein
MELFHWVKNFEKSEVILSVSQKTKGPVETSPLVLTNPLNSSTKLQIATTFQNNFF